MHMKTCTCPSCCSHRDALMPLQRFAFPAHTQALSEDEEVELAMELLGVSNEQELDQFLGKLVRRIGRGLKKVGSVAGKVLKPLGGALRGLAKKALPFVGGALGSFIPIPGVGTAIGTAVGSAVGKALEMEAGELEQDEAEFEMARRVVRIAADASQQALAASSRAAAPEAIVREALLAAVRAHVPQVNEAEMEAGRAFGEADFGESGLTMEEEVHHLGPYGGQARPVTGQWRRRGRRIALIEL